MQTAAANPNNFEYVARPRLPVVAEAVFASGWLLTIGLLNLFYAISVLAGSHIFITTASWLVGDARAEGWLMLPAKAGPIASRTPGAAASWINETTRPDSRPQSAGAGQERPLRGVLTAAEADSLRGDRGALEGAVISPGLSDADQPASRLNR